MANGWNDAAVSRSTCSYMRLLNSMSADAAKKTTRRIMIAYKMPLSQMCWWTKYHCVNFIFDAMTTDKYWFDADHHIVKVHIPSDSLEELDMKLTIMGA